MRPTKASIWEEHWMVDKRFMYEESMRTPLVMSLPKEFNKRGDVTEMVQNIDYAPTILQLAGVNVPSDIQGVSLLPLLKGQKTKALERCSLLSFPRISR